MIGHNVQIGRHSVLACKTAVGGSTNIGEYCLFGGGAAVSDNVTIAPRVTLTGGATIGKSISKPGVYTVFWPALEHSKWKRFVVKCMRSFSNRGGK